MEQQFDINEVIENYNLNENDVAEALFPKVRYKILALNRIRKKEANLDTEQLKALANLCGVLIHDLFTFDNWKGHWNNSDKCLTLVKGNYIAKLNYNNTYLVILDGEKIINKSIMRSAMDLDEFMYQINKIINEYENGNNC